MIYSCFNPKLGLYEYFQDNRAHPTNGDLPVPSFPAGQAGTVGVPAQDAGRPLPSEAKPVGSGWHAKGMIVSCTNAHVPGIGGLGGYLDLIREHPVIYLTVGALAVYGLWSLAVMQMQELSRR